MSYITCTYEADSQTYRVDTKWTLHPIFTRDWRSGIMRSDVCHTRHGFQDANLLRHLGNIFRIIIFSKAEKNGLALMCLMHTSTTVVTIMTWGLNSKLNRSHKNYAKQPQGGLYWRTAFDKPCGGQTLLDSIYVSRTHFWLNARVRRSLWNFLSAKAKRYFIGFKNWQKIMAQ